MGLTAEARAVKGLARVKGPRPRKRETFRGGQRWLEYFCYEEKMPRTDGKPKQREVTSEQGYLIR